MVRSDRRRVNRPIPDRQLIHVNSSTVRPG